MMIRLLLSFALGIPFGLGLHLMFRAVGIDIELPLTVLAMSAMSALSFLFFAGYKKVMDKRYAQVEAQIPRPVFHRTNGNFDLGCGKLKNGNIYFCDAGIICVSMEQKPCTLDEILVQDIHKISFDTIHLHIHTKDGRLFKITLPDAEEIIALLKERNWVE